MGVSEGSVSVSVPQIGWESGHLVRPISAFRVGKLEVAAGNTWSLCSPPANPREMEGWGDTWSPQPVGKEKAGAARVCTPLLPSREAGACLEGRDFTSEEVPISFSRPRRCVRVGLELQKGNQDLEEGEVKSGGVAWVGEARLAVQLQGLLV